MFVIQREVYNVELTKPYGIIGKSRKYQQILAIGSVNYREKLKKNKHCVGPPESTFLIVVTSYIQILIANI